MILCGLYIFTPKFWKRKGERYSSRHAGQSANWKVYKKDINSSRGFMSYALHSWSLQIGNKKQHNNSLHPTLKLTLLNRRVLTIERHYVALHQVFMVFKHEWRNRYQNLTFKDAACPARRPLRFLLCESGYLRHVAI